MSPSEERPGGRSLPILISLILIGGIALLPNLGPQVLNGNGTVEAYHGRILSIGTSQADQPYKPPVAQVLMLDGPRTGETVQAYVEGPGGSQVMANYQPGDEVVVTITPDANGAPYIAVTDRWRLPILGILGLIFAAAVVVVGGWRGLRSLLALGLTIAIILKVLIPLVIGGTPPVPLAVVTATFVTISTIALTEGLNRTSLAAILGTAAALSLTGLLSIASTATAGFTYTAGSDLAFLQTSGGQGLDLRGLLLAAFILGSVGVLDDVTVTQDALVDRLASRGAQGRELVSEALAVGRSHIAATVNTLFLAYVGVGLPLLVTLVVSQQPSSLVFNSEDVATEIIRTIVGSLGIVAAVPLTTVIAAILAAPARQGLHPRFPRVTMQAAVVGTSLGVIALALTSTAVLPLGPTPSAMPVERYDPSALPIEHGGPLPTDAGGSSDGDSQLPAPSDDGVEPPSGGDAGQPSPGEPELVAMGDLFPLTTASGTVEITIERVTTRRVANGLRVRLQVSYKNDGPGDFAVDPTSWTVLASDGSEVELASPSTGGLAATTIGVYHTAEGVLEGAFTGNVDDSFVAYTDDLGNIPFVVIMPPPS